MVMIMCVMCVILMKYININNIINKWLILCKYYY